MQKILATLAFLVMAACGSAATQATGPKLSNPPLASAKKATPPTQVAGQKADEAQALEVNGLSLKVNALAFQMTMASASWAAEIGQQEDGTPQLGLLRRDRRAVLVVIPIKSDTLDAKGMIDDQRKQATASGLTVSPAAAEPHGRYAFVVDITVNGHPLKTYFSIMPHPTHVAEAYLILMATCAPKDADAMFKEVRTMADSVSPIR